MNLVHFSKNQFSLDKERTYLQGLSFKPHGLWVSDESASMSWSEWCRREHFQEQNLEYRTELDIALSEVLLISSARDMKLFHLAYRAALPCSNSMTLINWAKVAKDHMGIIVTPYLWDFRLKFEYIWYYGWDCAGGCIWDLTCIRLAQLGP